MFKPVSLDELKVTKECCDWILPILKQHNFSDTSYEQEALDQVLNKVMRMEKALLEITKIRRKDGNDNEYEGAEVYIANKALLQSAR